MVIWHIITQAVGHLWTTTVAATVRFFFYRKRIHYYLSSCLHKMHFLYLLEILLFLTAIATNTILLL